MQRYRRTAIELVIVSIALLAGMAAMPVNLIETLGAVPAYALTFAGSVVLATIVHRRHAHRVSQAGRHARVARVVAAHRA